MSRVLAHAHTVWSYDGKLTLEAWRDLARRSNWETVLFAEHEETGWTPERYEEYVAACDRASTEHVRLIPGIEFNQNGFHVLCYGLRHWPARPSSVEDLAAAVHRQGCLLCLAHPVRYRWSYPGPLLRTVDAVEVWNSNWVCEGTLGPHPRTLQLAHDKRMLVGQDVHKPKHMSGLQIVTESSEVLTDLTAGRYVVRLGDRSWAPDELRDLWLAGGLQRCRTRVLRSALHWYRVMRRTGKRVLRTAGLLSPQLPASPSSSNRPEHPASGTASQKL